MSTNFEWGSGEAEDSFEALDEQEAWGTSGEASYDQEYQPGEYAESEGEWSYGEAEAQDEAEAVFDETVEMELASDLLSLGSEAELDQAVGKLMTGAARAVGGSIGRDVGQQLGSAIKQVAQQAISAAGSPGAAAGEIYGLETEGMSGEDQDFEVMRRLVRFAGAAAGRAARGARRGINPRALVRSSLMSAARRWAPGLLRRSRMRHRGQNWRRRPWRRRDRRPQWDPQFGAQQFPYPQPYPQQYPPGMAPPGMQPPQQPPFDPNANAGFGSPQFPPAPMPQGMPDPGAPMDAGGGDGPFPSKGRWTRQGGQLTIHL
jgi:hypothetical protein